MSPSNEPICDVNMMPSFSHSCDNSIYFSQSYGVLGGFVCNHRISADGGSQPHGRVPTPASGGRAGKSQSLCRHVEEIEAEISDRSRQFGFQIRFESKFFKI